MADDRTTPATTTQSARIIDGTSSSGEYVSGGTTTNAVENYLSILKRGINGTYQHVSATHLKRYVGEFDFRYNNRAESTG
jgi:ISXO2-like transposase domain